MEDRAVEAQLLPYEPSGESPCDNGYELLNGCSFTSTLSDLSQETILGPTQIRDTQDWEFWKI